ncbi:response regulator [Corallococcus sp. M34]|uniref:response regulator n=1 Tax=Citreicoccus inhibens TaxID=2849499 RepID=UPI0018F61F54|nr:response regulator [Citreicoccus inhibens]MBU8895810.1 response regulator [Citreicoccus inhibens]
MDASWAMGRCLLVVEDDEFIRLALAELLEDVGFAVITAGSFREAAGLLQRPRAIDVVLLDQELGDGVGSALVPLVRQVMPEAKVVFVTGKEDARLSPTADALFRKDGRFDELLAFLLKLLPSHAL